MKTDLTLAQWSHARHTGQAKSSELTAIMLQRIEVAGDVVFTHVYREQALSAATAADKRWSEGMPLSPIDGVPIAVKDYLILKVSLPGQALWHLPRRPSLTLMRSSCSV